MNITQDSMKTVARMLVVAAFVLVPIVPESALADPYSRPYSSPYRSPSYTSPSLPDYTYKSHSNSFSIGDYSRHTYKYKDSLGNRYKSKTQVLPGGTTVTRGRYRSPHTSPSLPDYTYKSRSNSFSVGDYHWHTYRYKDSLGNRHKGTIEVFPGGAVRHKGKVNGRKFKETHHRRSMVRGAYPSNGKRRKR